MSNNTSSACGESLSKDSSSPTILEEKRRIIPTMKRWLTKTVSVNLWKKLIIISVIITSMNAFAAWPTTFKFPSIDVVNYLNIVTQLHFEQSSHPLEEIMKSIYLRNEGIYLKNMGSITIMVDPSLNLKRGTIALRLTEGFQDFLSSKRVFPLLKVSTKLHKNLFPNSSGVLRYGDSSTDQQAKDFMSSTLLDLYQSNQFQKEKVVSMVDDLIRFKSYDRISVWGTIISSSILALVVAVDLCLKTSREHQIGLWSLCMLCLSSQIIFLLTQLVCLSVITHKFATADFAFSVVRCCIALVSTVFVLWYIFLKCSALAYRCDKKDKHLGATSVASSVYSEDLRISQATNMFSAPGQDLSTKIEAQFLASPIKPTLGSLDPFKKDEASSENGIVLSPKNAHRSPLATTRNVTVPLPSAKSLDPVPSTSAIPHPKAAEPASVK